MFIVGKRSWDTEKPKGIKYSKLGNKFSYPYY